MAEMNILEISKMEGVLLQVWHLRDSDGLFRTSQTLKPACYRQSQRRNSCGCRDLPYPELNN